MVKKDLNFKLEVVESLLQGVWWLLLILGISMIFAVFATGCSRSSFWNDGECSCGGHWKYEQAVGHAYTTSYIYQCDECGSIIEIDEYAGGKYRDVG